VRCDPVPPGELTSSYILQAIRLSALRTTDDSLTPRIISLSPDFALNPYIVASGLSDLDRWPEIKRALDSPPLDPIDRPRRRPSNDRAGSLNYTQTIMGGRSGALGMRVNGRAGRGERKEAKNGPSSAGGPASPLTEKTPRGKVPTTDGFFSPPGRPRADSAPIPQLLVDSRTSGTSVITTGRGMGGVLDSAGLLEYQFSPEVSGIELGSNYDSGEAGASVGAFDPSIAAAGVSGRPLANIGLASEDTLGNLGTTLLDDGSDVDEDELDDEGDLFEDTRELPDPGLPSNRSSIFPDDDEPLDFAPVAVFPRHSISGPSALTSLLNKHVPHLVSTSTAPAENTRTADNPFASLYASAAALSNVPSISLELYFPHSDNPSQALITKVRKDATVEEVTGYGLYRYWEDALRPLLAEQAEQRWSTVGWGLRIVEDDGEVDEDFPRE